MSLGGFVASVRSGELSGAFIEPGTPLDETLGALSEFLDPDTLTALSRSTGVAKARLLEEPYTKRDRDELVTWMAEEGWLDDTLRMAYACEKRAAAKIAGERLFSIGNDDFVVAALHQAVTESTTIPVSDEVATHALIELARASGHDPEAAEDLTEIFNRAEVLTRTMIELRGAGE